MTDNVDVIIIGGGPAAILCGAILKRENLRFHIFEKGKAHKDRDREDPYDVSSGFAGAGLFSDGKLSYPPSASWMWKNLMPRPLENAYTDVQNWLGHCGINIDEWNADWLSEKFYDNSDDLKTYKSDYLDQTARDVVSNIAMKELSRYTSMCTEIVEISKEDNLYTVRDNYGKTYTAKRIVYATGKAALSKDIWTYPTINRHFMAEVGVRIEVPTKNFVPAKTDNRDYKIIDSTEDGIQIRTFCSCKNGRMLESRYNDHVTFNGEAGDTGKGTIGIVIRVSDSDNKYIPLFRQVIESNEKICKSLKDYMCVTGIYGDRVDDMIRKRISSLVTNSNYDGSVVAPEIEKWGYYPVINSDLCDSDGNLWIGDSTGVFRGLLAAFVSGAYAGEFLLKERDQQFNSYVKKLGIRVSSTQPMPVVFTAQSKKDFYCRDAICQFVFEHGCLPVNPFRLFGYFLDDRVDRDTIRRGNNQMISSADELWVFGDIANGVLFEIASALRQHKKLRFFTVATRASEIKELPLDAIKFEPEVHAGNIKKKDLIEFIQNEGGSEEPGYRQIDMYEFIDRQSRADEQQ